MMIGLVAAIIMMIIEMILFISRAVKTEDMTATKKNN
jgi:hypothetical protein